MKLTKRTLMIVAIVAIAAVLCALALILGQPWKNAQESLMNPDDPSVTTPVDPIAPFVPDTPPEVADGVITRGETEAALAEVAWDYFVKGVKVQYDSMDLNTRNDGTNEPLSKYSGGFWRTTTTSTLEDADSDTYLFTVCSDYAWNVYYETLGYPILGNRLNCHTSQFWRGTEAPDDMVVLRWHNKGKGVYLSDYDDDYGMTFDDWYEHEDLKNFLMNWKETLRPGDIITQRTGNSAHTVLYVGNGMILHSNGDGKYNMVKGTDKPETEGSISMHYVEDYYFTEGNIFNLDAMQRSSSQSWICVVRPLDILTKDDGDSDPSNDVLDPDYVLDTGKLNAQLSIDPRPLQTSGYTIKDTTFTRMAYPGMDIDRTVDITPYGTVAKDGTLTYTIEISNRSTNPKYVTYRSYGQSKLYVGEAYEGLVIEEHVPENTVLVSAPGAYVEGETLRWQVDIPRGKSVVLTYTVKVTGEIGEKIVNGGGLVANIPSNTLTNVIGGAKLSEEALQNMDSFAQAPKSKWNSNDGYKITAAMTAGTVFAERIYNETTGLDLQLPEIQELIDILFNYEKINVKKGLYLAHGTGPDSPGVTRYMYTLNKTAADPNNQIYCDMVIDGYFGGVWAFSNDYAGEPRTYEFRTDYLEPGDIIIHTRLTPSPTDGAAEETRKVEEWNVVVYLGNDTFASLSSDGRLKKIKDDSAIVPGFSYDLFVGLRPSQAYANINTDVAAFIGPAKDLTDEDMATGYEGNISDVLLNDKNSAALAALKASDFKQHSGKFIGEVYSKIGLDVVTDGTMNSSYSTVVKALFADNPNDSSSAAFMEYGREYHLLEEPLGGTEKLYDMLMYYGGPAFVDSEDITSLSDLHPGDAIMLGRGISALDEPLVNFGSMDVVAVYQGDGKFLVSIRDLAGTYYGTPDYRQWTTKSFSSDEAFTSWLAAPIVAGNSDLFEGYVVLRPSRVFEDVNTMAYAGDNSIVADGSQISSKRSITDRVLNNAEKLLMANLTVADWFAAEMPTNLIKIPSWIYSKQLNIKDISNYFDQTMFYLRNGLFYKSGSWYHLSDMSRANHVEKYHQMMVSKRYGGFNIELSRTLKESDFQIGDLFCAWTVDKYGKNIYWVGLYQGNYQFLLIRNGGTDSIKVAEEAYLTEFNARISNGDYAFYFILRPEQLAGGPRIRDIADGELTAKEKKGLAAITVEDWKYSGKKNNQGAALWFYNEINVNIAKNFDKSVFNLMYAIFNEKSWKPNGPDHANYQKYVRMLVSDYYGGIKFGKVGKTFKSDGSDFEIGDLFCAYTEVLVEGAKKRAYYVGLYQGDGKFLMTQTGYGVETDAYVDSRMVYASNIASKFMCYYVIRPNQLNREIAPVELRDITTGVLTDAEKKSLSALTVNQYNAVGTTAANQKLVSWAYGEAGVDVSASFDQSVFNLMKKIFEGDGTKGRTPIPADSASYDAKYSKMLIEGYYGGTEVKTADKLFTAADFQVGDVFCAVYYPDPSSTAKNYYVGIYLGDGKFLMSCSDGGWSAKIDAELVFKTTLAEEMGIYFILRPELLALPDEPVVELRDITTGVLTDPEKALLSALTVEKYTAAGTEAANQKLAVWAYKEAGVDVSASFDQSVFNLMKKIFEGDGTEGRTPIPSDSANYIAKYGDMLVDGYYGGTEVKTADKLFTPADFQVGDLFCAVYYPDPSSTSKCYYAGIYLGEGKFLLSCSEGGWSAQIDTELVFKSTLAEEMGIYFVLSPEQLAPRADDELPVAVQRKLSALTKADLDAANKTNDTGVIKWFCQQEGMTSDDVKNFSSILSMSNSLFNKPSNEYWSYKAGDTTYHKLFVDGYYGGIKFGAENSKTFTEADFKVGDIFCVQAPNGSSTRYYVGMYQGDGKFLMYDRTGASNYVDTTMAFGDIATTYNYYFVLRPSQYIYSAN